MESVPWPESLYDRILRLRVAASGTINRVIAQEYSRQGIQTAATARFMPSPEESATSPADATPASTLVTPTAGPLKPTTESRASSTPQPQGVMIDDDEHRHTLHPLGDLAARQAKASAEEDGASNISQLRLLEAEVSRLIQGLADSVPSFSFKDDQDLVKSSGRALYGGDNGTAGGKEIQELIFKLRAQSSDYRAKCQHLETEVHAMRAVCDRKDVAIDYIRTTLYQEVNLLREQSIRQSNNPNFPLEFISLFDYAELLKGTSTSSFEAEEAVALAKKESQAEISKVTQKFTKQLHQRETDIEHLKREIGGLRSELMEEGDESAHVQLGERSGRSFKGRRGSRIGGSGLDSYGVQQLEILSAELAKKTEILEALRETNKLQEEDVAKAQLESGKSKDQVHQLGMEIERILEVKDAEITTKTRQLQQLDAKVKQLEAEVTNAKLVEKKCDSMNRDLINTKEELFTAQTELSRVTKELANVSQSEAALREEIEKERNQRADGASFQIMSQEKTIKKLESQIDAQTGHLEKITEEKEDLAQELLQARQELELLAQEGKSQMGKSQSLRQSQRSGAGNKLRAVVNALRSSQKRSPEQSFMLSSEDEDDVDDQELMLEEMESLQKTVRQLKDEDAKNRDRMKRMEGDLSMAIGASTDTKMLFEELDQERRKQSSLQGENDSLKEKIQDLSQQLLNMREDRDQVASEREKSPRRKRKAMQHHLAPLSTEGDDMIENSSDHGAEAGTPVAPTEEARDEQVDEGVATPTADVVTEQSPEKRRVHKQGSTQRRGGGAGGKRDLKRSSGNTKHSDSDGAATTSREETPVVVPDPVESMEGSLSQRHSPTKGRGSPGRNLAVSPKKGKSGPASLANSTRGKSPPQKESDAELRQLLDASMADVESLRAQLANMLQQNKNLTSRVGQLEGELGEGKKKSASAPEKKTSPTPAKSSKTSTPVPPAIATKKQGSSGAESTTVGQRDRDERSSEEAGRGRGEEVDAEGMTAAQRRLVLMMERIAELEGMVESLQQQQMNQLSASNSQRAAPKDRAATDTDTTGLGTVSVTVTGVPKPESATSSTAPVGNAAPEGQSSSTVPTRTGSVVPQPPSSAISSGFVVALKCGGLHYPTVATSVDELAVAAKLLGEGGAFCKRQERGAVTLYMAVPDTAFHELAKFIASALELSRGYLRQHHQKDATPHSILSGAVALGPCWSEGYSGVFGPTVSRALALVGVAQSGSFLLPSDLRHLLIALKSHKSNLAPHQQTEQTAPVVGGGGDGKTFCLREEALTLRCPSGSDDETLQLRVAHAVDIMVKKASSRSIMHGGRKSPSTPASDQAVDATTVQGAEIPHQFRLPESLQLLWDPVPLMSPGAAFQLKHRDAIEKTRNRLSDENNNTAVVAQAGSTSKTPVDQASPSLTSPVQHGAGPEHESSATIPVATLAHSFSVNVATPAGAGDGSNLMERGVQCLLLTDHVVHVAALSHGPPPPVSSVRAPSVNQPVGNRPGSATATTQDPRPQETTVATPSSSYSSGVGTPTKQQISSSVSQAEMGCQTPNHDSANTGGVKPASRWQITQTEDSYPPTLAHGAASQNVPGQVRPLGQHLMSAEHIPNCDVSGGPTSHHLRRGFSAHRRTVHGSKTTHSIADDSGEYPALVVGAGGKSDLELQEMMEWDKECNSPPRPTSSGLGSMPGSKNRKPPRSASAALNRGDRPSSSAGVANRLSSKMTGPTYISQDPSSGVEPVVLPQGIADQSKAALLHPNTTKESLLAVGSGAGEAGRGGEEGGMTKALGEAIGSSWQRYPSPSSAMVASQVVGVSLSLDARPASQLMGPLDEMDRCPSYPGMTSRSSNVSPLDNPLQGPPSDMLTPVPLTDGDGGETPTYPYDSMLGGEEGDRQDLSRQTSAIVSTSTFRGGVLLAGKQAPRTVDTRGAMRDVFVGSSSGSTVRGIKDSVRRSVNVDAFLNTYGQQSATENDDANSSGNPKRKAATPALFRGLPTHSSPNTTPFLRKPKKAGKQLVAGAPALVLQGANQPERRSSSALPAQLRR